MTDRIVFEDVSRFYGEILGVNHVNLSIPPGVTSLVGPNGSGKTTLMNLMTGLIQPTQGAIRVLGIPPTHPDQLFLRTGYCTQFDAFPKGFTGYEFIYSYLRVHGKSHKEADRLALEALERVNMTEAAGRNVAAYSKGMRQRIKLAGALVHDPHVLLMDDPLNGTDPEQRAHMIRLMWELGRQGKTLLVSSHVLSEVERFAENIIVIINGKLAAAGNYRTIRERIDNHPHIVRLGANEPRKLASALVTLPQISSVRIDKDGRVFVETGELRDFYRMVPRLAQQQNVRLTELQAADESLESVFSYLVER